LSEARRAAAQAVSPTPPDAPRIDARETRAREARVAVLTRQLEVAEAPIATARVPISPPQPSTVVLPISRPPYVSRPSRIPPGHGWMGTAPSRHRNEPTSPACNPPWTVDDEGIRHVKMDCL
jgi:hypothetical protein